MAGNRQLGVFWGKDILYFVESVGDNPHSIFSVPFTDEAKGSLDGGPLGPVGMEIVSLIQNALRQHKVSAPAVHLSLPPKDIIFRSFTIPWMQPGEIKSVVDFEAGKYVPFALEELSYSFYPIPFTEGPSRRIRVIFVAIKKILLENYIKILEQASLNVSVIEPSTISLIRALIFKGSILSDQAVALIEKGEEAGNIIVIDQQLPQFVREFSLRIPLTDQAGMDADALMTRLVNEIRISLNYFNRQEERLHVKSGMLLTPAHAGEIVKRLEEDLRVPFSSVTVESILQNAGFGDVNFLKAYGVTLVSAVTSLADFNLSESRPKTVKLGLKPASKSVDYKFVVKVALMCFPLMIVASSLTGFLTKRKETQLMMLTQQLKSFKDTSVNKLQEQNQNLSKKTDYLKGIRTGSDVASFLAIIPTLLPEGIWMDSIEIIYPEALSPEQERRKKEAIPADQSPGQGEGSKPTLVIQGYAYREDTNEQFKQVNELLKNFKENKEFSAFFNHIDFETIQAKNMGNYPVTFFHLRCQ
jgi:hypothetical protein